MLPELSSASASRPPKHKGANMDYEERLKRLNEHLLKHPTDYQARIAKLTMYSRAVEHQIYLRKVARLKKVAKYRRERNGAK